MFVHRPDARLFSLAFGNGSRTLLALGGWVGSGELWQAVFGHLPGWRCVSYDHRGSGASTHASSPITLDAMVDDLFAVAEAQQTGPCVLAAESSGAGVALEAMLRHPERFRGLVVVGGSWRRPPPGAYDGFIAQLRANYDAVLQGFVAQCVPEPDADDERRWGLQIVRRSPLEHAVELLQSRYEYATEGRLEGIRVPALVIHGTLDRIVPADESRALAASLPDATLHLLEGLGHVPLVTAPQRIAALIDERFPA